LSLKDERSPEAEKKLLAKLNEIEFLRLRNIRPIYLFSVDSTQSYIASEVKDPREGDLVIAETQTEGRGRKGKTWVSQKGGLWMSITLKPEDPRVLQDIPIVATSSVLNSLVSLGLAECNIKPPNDVHYRGKKIAGVLADTIVERTRSTVYLGIGVNVNNDTTEIESISEIATSVKKELGRETDLNQFTVSLLKNLDWAYDRAFSSLLV